MKARRTAFGGRWMYPTLLGAAIAVGCSDDAAPLVAPAPAVAAVDPQASFEAFVKRFESRYQSFVARLDATATISESVDGVTFLVTKTDDPMEPYRAEMTLKVTTQYTEIHLPSNVRPVPTRSGGVDGSRGGGDSGGQPGDPAAGDPASGDPLLPDGARRGDGASNAGLEDPNSALFDQPPIGQLDRDSQTTYDTFYFGFRDNRWYLKTNEVQRDAAKLAIERALEQP
jgi:hypothetical protein